MATSKAIVLFGATGDLALRMLYPSFYFLEADGLLPEQTLIIGAARSKLSAEDFAAQVEKAVAPRVEGGLDAGVWAKLKKRLRYIAIDAKDSASFEPLCPMLQNVDEPIFYLSTSPSLYAAISANLRQCGVAHGKSRVIVEKPLGRDLASCRAINDALAETFTENRIFRVDHYLGKEAVQNLLALRFANTLFEPLWNKQTIDHVQITVAETVGIEGRWDYYDDYGAIRDMVQNHMLQMLCLVAMEPPTNLDPDSVRDEKVKVLRSLRPLNGKEVDKNSVRGQYTKGVAEGQSVPGYTEEAEGKPSDTETFAALCAHIDNWRWAGVPFYLRTGKRMPVRSTQIVIQFREVPHSIFEGADLLANRLEINLQPEEEISLMLMNKTPSITGMDLRPLALNLNLDDAFKTRRRRIAYERLLLEAINNNPTLFVRRDEAEAAWAWIDAIAEGWKRMGMAAASYPAGTWGPSGAFALTERNGHTWFD